MGERCARLCLATEPLTQHGIDAIGGRQDLDGDSSIEPGVDSAKDLTHLAFTDEPIDLVGTERGTRREARCRLDQFRRHVPDRSIHKARLVVLGQQRLQFTTQGDVVTAYLRDE